MLCADDVVLLSYTVTGLQRQLNILRDTARKLGLVVNFQKSKCGCVQDWWAYGST